MPSDVHLPKMKDGSLPRTVRRVPGRLPSSVPGFTLLELIVAAAISALVIGILSVCFSFALRLWQSVHNEKPDQTFRLADLLERQLAECDPIPVRLSNNIVRPLFVGQSNSITFVTDHSLKAISRGAPVIVRYTYDRNSKVLSYSELLLDPYRPVAIKRFMAGRSTAVGENAPRSYGVDFPEFRLAYAGREAKEFSQSWYAEDRFPVEVLLRWKSNDLSVHALVCMVNSPFTIEGIMGLVPGITQ